MLVGLLLLQLKPCEEEENSPPDDASLPSILDALPGTSSCRKLDILLTNIEAFSQLYSSVANSVARQVEPKSYDEDEDVIGQSAEKQQVHMGKERAQSDVVSDVVMSLRALRDEL